MSFVRRWFESNSSLHLNLPAQSELLFPSFMAERSVENAELWFMCWLVDRKVRELMAMAGCKQFNKFVKHLP